MPTVSYGDLVEQPFWYHLLFMWFLDSEVITWNHKLGWCFLLGGHTLYQSFQAESIDHIMDKILVFIWLLLYNELSVGYLLGHTIYTISFSFKCWWINYHLSCLLKVPIFFPFLFCCLFNFLGTFIIYFHVW